MNKEDCLGCEIEMEECYNFQQLGYDAGLNWGKIWELDGLHCSVFALDKKGVRVA